jgi:hypothetical protein
MRVVILYRPQSEHSRMVEEYAHDFTNRHEERFVDLISLDTVEGADKARVYGVVQYPAVLAMDDSGHMLKLWEGEQLPLMSELAYYETL